MKTDAEIASELVTRICSNYRTVGAAMYDEPRERLCLAIAAALAAARAVPEGYVRVGTTDHRLLGTLPMTADGCAIGEACTVWHEDANWETMRRPQFCEREIRRGPAPLSRCYSSLAAATAARDAGKGITAP